MRVLKFFGLVVLTAKQYDNILSKLADLAIYKASTSKREKVPR